MRRPRARRRWSVSPAGSAPARSRPHSGGRDLGVFTGRPADVVVCRATVASVLLAGRVAALCGRPVVAVTAVDTGKPSSALRSRLALLEPHTAAVVALPWVPQWRDLVDPLQELHDQLTRPAGKLPRPVGGYLAALAAIHTALTPMRLDPSTRFDPARCSAPPHPRAARTAGTRQPELRRRAVPGRAARGMSTTLAQPPNPGPAVPPGLGAFADQIIGWMKWGVLVAGVLGILVCAVMIILGRRNRSATAYEGLVGSAWILGGLALASVAAVVVGAFQAVNAMTTAVAAPARRAADRATGCPPVARRLRQATAVTAGAPAAGARLRGLRSDLQGQRGPRTTSSPRSSTRSRTVPRI